MRLLILSFIFVITFPYKCNKPNKTQFPVFGIDISHHQGRVNWDRLKSSEVDFIFMKSSEGGESKDSMFRFNWAMARTLQIKSGAYHYFTFCRSGSDQARNFLEAVSLVPGDLPPVIDLEFGGNCKRNVFNRERLISEIEVFLKLVEEKYCSPVLIYTTNEFYKDYISGKFPNNPVWIREVLVQPHLPDNKDWTFWQYRVDTLSGVKGEVDMNVFNGSREEFNDFLLDSCYHPVSVH